MVEIATPLTPRQDVNKGLPKSRNKGPQNNYFTHVCANSDTHVKHQNFISRSTPRTEILMCRYPSVGSGNTGQEQRIRAYLGRKCNAMQTNPPRRPQYCKAAPHKRSQLCLCPAPPEPHRLPMFMAMAMEQYGHVAPRVPMGSQNRSEIS